MTRPPKWHSGATPADLRLVGKLDREIALATAERRRAIAERRAIVQRCLSRATRRAK